MNQQEDFARRKSNRNKTFPERRHKATARGLVQVALNHRKLGKGESNLLSALVATVKLLLSHSQRYEGMNTEIMVYAVVGTDLVSCSGKGVSNLLALLWQLL